MCFSANASFLASAGIGAVGAATLLKKPTIRELPLALIPVCFSVQQASEGIVWLTLPTGGLLHSVAVKVFLLFATMLWPVLVPIAFYLVEQDSSRRKKMRFGIGLGLAVVAYLLYYLPSIAAVASCVPKGGHLDYEPKVPHFYTIVAIYSVVVVGAGLLAKNRLLKTFSGLLGIGVVATYFAAEAALMSVWCFFSAILSTILYFYFHSKNRAMGMDSGDGSSANYKAAA